MGVVDGGTGGNTAAVWGVSFGIDTPRRIPLPLLPPYIPPLGGAAVGGG